MKTYTAMKSSGKWYLKNTRGHMLAQEFKTINEMVKFAKKYLNVRVAI